MRDFFYKHNDIIIALIILVAAAFVIYDRTEAIMHYEPTPVATEEDADQPSETKATEATEADATEAADADAKADQEYITIKISDKSTLSDVANTLESKGLIKSADDFIQYAEDKGKSSSIITGTYKIAEGTSQKGILEAITK